MTASRDEGLAGRRLNEVRRHFDAEAGAFDARVRRIVPHYQEMIEALVDALPFTPARAIRVADLGCGTGAVARRVKERFPRARITCVDLSANMLDLAARNLAGLADVSFELAELGAYEFTARQDAVVSSLALHHIAPGKTKAALYRRVLAALRPGGVFVTADIIASADKPTQQRYLDRWAEFILRSYSRQELEANHRRYKKEDRPADLLHELATLRKVGFRVVEVFWKSGNFATYGAKA